MITIDALSVSFASSGVSSQVSGMMDRIYAIIISISAILIAILWIPIAIGFFSSDENKKVDAKNRLKNATIGTLIYVLAISGILYTVFTYIVTGS
ncbi:MAG: hypothetical protein M1402_02790 [Candidatus Thermoplasmatota archaeon]|nr:hypothetical protein [Candidatus Thermoplasmatota archaeon]